MQVSRALKAWLPLFIGLALSLIFLFWLSPDSLVTYIGLKNAYALMFVMAALGGMSTFNTVPYYSIIFVLASAGVEPLLLGLASALGVMAGDSFSYLIGRNGAASLSPMLQSLFSRLHRAAVRHPKSFPIVCFVYGSMSPLSNDFITIPAGIAKISYWRVMVPLGLGNIVFNVAFAYVCIYAYDVVQTFFIA
jgi:membrane protein YqaA with SNARE-associated domain